MNNKIMGIVFCGAVLTVPTFTNGVTAASVTATPVSSVAAMPSVNVEQKMAQYINGNLFGIQSIKKDANGRIVSVVSIGRAPLTSALTKAKAKNQAFKKADANARAEFMKWLTTAVVYTRIDQDDIAIVQHGESLGDAGSGKASEKSEATELTQEQIVSVAAGFVKGMVQIGAGMNDDGEAVVVLGWNADLAGQMDEVRDSNIPRKPARGIKEKKPEVGSGATAMPNKATSVSDAANEYL